MTEEVSSPPRIRGTHGVMGVEGVATELTPAHTGNTKTGHSGESSNGAHPRAYGEHEGFGPGAA